MGPQNVKKRTELLQKKIKEHKAAYSNAMKHLEVLSERMHQVKSRSSSMLALPTHHLQPERRAATPDIIRPHSHRWQRQVQTPDLKRHPEILNHVHVDQTKLAVFICIESPEAQESSGSALTNVQLPPAHEIEEKKSKGADEAEVKQLVEQCLKNAWIRYQQEFSSTTSQISSL